jgi:hypothetical protein
MTGRIEAPIAVFRELRAFTLTVQKKGNGYIGDV